METPQNRSPKTKRKNELMGWGGDSYDLVSKNGGQFAGGKDQMSGKQILGHAEAVSQKKFDRNVVTISCSYLP